LPFRCKAEWGGESGSDFPFSVGGSWELVCWCGFAAVPAARIVSTQKPANVQNSQGFPQTQQLQDCFAGRLWLSSRRIEALRRLDSGANRASCSGREQKKTKIPRAYGPQGFSCLSAAPMESRCRSPMVKRQWGRFTLSKASVSFRLCLHSSECRSTAHSASSMRRSACC
jgi:hypothetical protein